MSKFNTTCVQNTLKKSREWQVQYKTSYGIVLNTIKDYSSGSFLSLIKYADIYTVNLSGYEDSFFNKMLEFLEYNIPYGMVLVSDPMSVFAVFGGVIGEVISLFGHYNNLPAVLTGGLIGGMIGNTIHNIAVHSRKNSFECALVDFIENEPVNYFICFRGNYISVKREDHLVTVREITHSHVTKQVYILYNKDIKSQEYQTLQKEIKKFPNIIFHEKLPELDQCKFEDSSEDLISGNLISGNIQNNVNDEL